MQVKDTLIYDQRDSAKIQYRFPLMIKLKYKLYLHKIDFTDDAQSKEDKTIFKGNEPILSK